MTQFVYIDSLITILILILSVGMLFWLVKFRKREDRREFRKGLAWLLPIIAISFVDIFVCISIIMQLPVAPIGVKASDGQFIDKVIIQWKPAAKANTYTVLRAARPDGPYDEIGSNISGTSFVDTSLRPGRFYYKVVASNEMGNSTQSTPDPGNRAITDYEFFSLYRSTAQGGIEKLKKLGALGHEKEPGAVSGSVAYDAIFDGRAHVTNTYSNYCDFSQERARHMILNGTLSTETDMWGNGTLKGRIDAIGNYSGSVGYNLIISRKENTGGYFTVMQSGGKAETVIPWNYK